MSMLAHCQAICRVKDRHLLKCAELTAYQATGDAGPAVQELATEIMQLQKKLVCLRLEANSRFKLLSGVFVVQVIGTTVFGTGRTRIILAETSDANLCLQQAKFRRWIVCSVSGETCWF